MINPFLISGCKGTKKIATVSLRYDFLNDLMFNVSHSHAARRSQRRHNSGRYRCNHLHNELNCFFLIHNVIFLIIHVSSKVVGPKPQPLITIRLVATAAGVSTAIGGIVGTATVLIVLNITAVAAGHALQHLTVLVQTGNLN